MKYINWLIISLLILATTLFHVEKREILREIESASSTPVIQVEPQIDPLDVWIEQLGDMERCAPAGTWDSGSYSYGRWCYKERTFKYFVRDYFGYDLLPYTEDAELMNWIGDEQFQRKITRMAFEKSYKNTSHWYTSVYVRKLGEPPII